VSPLGDRPTRDVVVLMVTATLCAVLLLAGAGLATVVVLHPESDVSDAAGRLWHGVTILLGVVAGYLGGRRASPGSGDGER